MANLKLTNLASYRAYFAAIAASHIAIDGYKFGDKDVIRNDNRSDMPARLLWAIPYDAGKFGDQYSDNIFKSKTATVAYLIVPDSTLYAHEEVAFDQTEAVIEQILAKIMADKRGSLTGGEWSFIATDINTWSIAPVEYSLGATRYIGCELTLTFKDNANLTYDPTQWRAS